MSLAANAPFPALLLAALATLVVSGCALTVDLDDDALRRTETTHVPTAGIALLDVRTGNGSVEVRAAATDEIEVHSIMRESDAGDADVRIETDGDRLVVRGECDAGWFEQCSVSFRIAAPDDLDLTVATDNGAIGVAGPVGDVDLRTDNGAIDADDLGGGTAIAQSDNGRIDLAFSVAPEQVRAETDNGSISIRVPDDGRAYDVTAASDNGGVDVDVATDAAARRRIAADSDNGSIRIRHDAPTG